MDPAAGKAALRAGLIAGRRARSAAERDVAHARVEEHLRQVAQDRATLALFLPLSTEPLARRTVGSLAESHRVLLPVATAGRPLDWAEAGGGVRPGAFGIDEPAGPTLGPDALLGADLVVLPALAVDRSGARLGRGGGHYDRTLALLGDAASRRPRLVAVVFDDELLDQVPVEATDRNIDAVLTPSSGVLTVRPASLAGR